MKKVFLFFLPVIAILVLCNTISTTPEPKPIPSPTPMVYKITGSYVVYKDDDGYNVGVYFDIPVETNIVLNDVYRCNNSITCIINEPINSILVEFSRLREFYRTMNLFETKEGQYLFDLEIEYQIGLPQQSG